MAKNLTDPDKILPPNDENDFDRFVELLEESKFSDFEMFPPESIEFEGGYRLHCAADNDPQVHSVNGLILRLVPASGMYLHVDLELPCIGEEDILHLSVTTKRGTKTVEDWYGEANIPLLIYGNRVHLKPFPVTSLFDKEYVLSEGESDAIIITLDNNDKPLGKFKIAIDGPWSVVEEKEFGASAMDRINQCLGWEGFKQRMVAMCTRSKVGLMRTRAGLAKNPPRLHTAIIGNAGTGKTRAVEMMAGLYRDLGLLDSDKIVTTCVSSLASSTINSENDSIQSLIDDAIGGTLVIDRAHELFRTDKPGYDSEARIIRSLVDALNDKRSRHWMLVLAGETEGMEYMLANYPELRRCLSEPIYLEDFTPEELFSMFEQACTERGIKLSDAARQKLRMFILHKYNHRGAGFQNARMVLNLLDDEIIPAMYNRLSEGAANPDLDLELVLPEDIPVVGTGSGNPVTELDQLVGLAKIKTRVKDYLNAVKLARRRMEMGLPTNMPRLHMAFLGNPGTGKTTVAEIIGRVFASWGILSGGRVIRTEKSQMVGQYIGETELKMTNLLARSRGNILFIDEAYQLVEEGDKKDYGRIVMNSLLTELGKDNPDMVVILAGYTAPMKKLMESNEGIESRFPNVFNFEDYTTDELMEIGRLMIRRQGFTLTEGAARNMRTIIEQESDRPSPRFGNGRFVSNLIQNEILATLGERTLKIDNPTREDLSIILPEDVVVGKALKDVVFDDLAIDAALARLDALSGLDGVKKAIHNFVQSARYLHSIGEAYVGRGLLSWRFIGNTGTGKSTVAEIMAGILRGMRLISNSHITEIKGERIFNVSEHDCDEVLREAVKKSCNGLIFIDADEPKFSEERMNYGRNVEQVLLKIKELTVETGGECALILAELNAPNANVAEQLSESGIYEFDHTLIFKDFTPDELYGILTGCLAKYGVRVSKAAEKHLSRYIQGMSSSIRTNARTMKLMSRTIYQQVILRESGMSPRPDSHLVELEDVQTFRWDSKKGKIGF